MIFDGNSIYTSRALNFPKVAVPVTVNNVEYMIEILEPQPVENGSQLYLQLLNSLLRQGMKEFLQIIDKGMYESHPEDINEDKMKLYVGLKIIIPLCVTL